MQEDCKYEKAKAEGWVICPPYMPVPCDKYEFKYFGPILMIREKQDIDNA